MPTVPIPIKFPQAGVGYTDPVTGRFVDVQPILPLPPQTFVGVGTVGGITAGDVWDIGKREAVRLTLAITAKAGTSPTLDVTIMTSPDGVNDWKSAGTFAQKTDAAAPPFDGLIMSAVGAAGTTPPTVTFTGTQVQPVNFRMECTTAGARGTAVVRYSIDGGKTYVSNVLTAATIAVIDPNGTDTGLIINYANATAATDNVWTATTVGQERKVFNALDRFIRAVALLGGTATPTMTGYLTGELV